MARIVFLQPPRTGRRPRLSYLQGGARPVPQGLATLAAVARRAGHDALVLDAPAQRIGVDECARRVLRSAADVVLATATTAELAGMTRVARYLKDARSPILIALEGVHVSGCPEETLLRTPQLDLGLVGEAEATLPEVLAAFETGSSLDEVPGVVLRRAGRIRFGPERPPIEDLDSLPPPAWDLLPPLRRHYRPRLESMACWPGIDLATSRGCPGRCRFCDRSQYGGRVRAYSAGYVLALLEELSGRWGIRYVQFDEDAFLALPERLEAICAGLARAGLRLAWGVRGRPDQIDPAWLPAAVAAGLRHAALEIESASQAVLDEMGKGWRVEDVAPKIELLRRHGVRVTGLFMAGGFGETQATLAETLAFVRRAPLDGIVVTRFAPLPGTEAYIVAPRHGRFDPAWEAAQPLAGGSFVPRGLTGAELEEFRRAAHAVVVRRPAYLAAVLASAVARPQIGLRRLHLAWRGTRDRAGHAT